MSLTTDALEERPKERKPKPTTVGIPPLVLARLECLKIVDTEPVYSVIQRLLEEHDTKSMRKIISKRVR